MNKTVKILLGTGAATVLVAGVVHVVKTSNTADKIDVDFENYSLTPKSLKGLGKFSIPQVVIFKTDAIINNPTHDDLVISKPYLKVFYNGKQVGNSTASEETINLKANGVSTIKDLEVEFRALNLLTSVPDFLLYLFARLKGAKPAKKIQIQMLVDANGIATTQTKEILI